MAPQGVGRYKVICKQSVRIAQSVIRHTDTQTSWPGNNPQLEPDLVTVTRESPRSAFSVASSFLCLDVVLYNRVDIV